MQRRTSTPGAIVMKKWNGVGSPRDMAGCFMTDELDFAVAQTRRHQNLREQYPASNACSMMDESGGRNGVFLRK